MTSMYDVLKASKGLPVDDIFAELWGRKLSGDYTIDVYTGTLPATLTGTKAGYLHSYKIYGNTGENIADMRYSLVNRALGSTGNVAVYTGYSCTWYIPVKPSTTYAFNSDLAQAPDACTVLYDSNLNLTRAIWQNSRTQYNFTTTSTTAYMRTTYKTGSKVSIAEGSSYLSYDTPVEMCGELTEGNLYKIPLISAGQQVDIYTTKPLSYGEYVDSVTGKVYRVAGRTEDPPIPFPQIPTTAGSTTISWAGQGLAPSEVEFEYERRR